MRLRRRKDRSELSKHGLAARTGYSARSWQRYLNGRSLPPREAVESMARVGGDDPNRLLVLHEIAAQRWSEGRVGTATVEDSSPAPEHTPTGQQTQGRHLRVVVTAAAVITALPVTVALLLAVRLTEARAQLVDGRSGVSATAVATVSESMVPVIHTCELEQRNGRWYAGLSRTTDTLLSNTQVGIEVA